MLYRVPGSEISWPSLGLLGTDLFSQLRAPEHVQTIQVQSIQLDKKTKTKTKTKKRSTQVHKTKH